MRYEQSETIGALAAALAKAQGAMEGAPKDANNPFFKSKYADLASVWGACRKQLSDNGLAIVQAAFGDTYDQAPSVIGVATTLVHDSGEWMRGTISMIPDKPGPQAAGSVLTYCRRYALAAMVGVYQEDDDAEAAMPARPAKWVSVAPAPKRPSTKPGSPKGHVREDPKATAAPTKDGQSPKLKWFIGEIEKSTGKDDLEVFYKNSDKILAGLDDKELPLDAVDERARRARDFLS